MRFSKWQALGNTYLLVERGDLVAPLGADDVRRLCDPHHGVGADGVLEIGEVRGAEAHVVVWNPDGSSAELSGNGARIAAVWLARRSGVAFPRLHIGERTVPARVEGEDVEVDLGEAKVGKPEALEIDGERLEVTPVDVGNPHAVIRREPDARRASSHRTARRASPPLPRAHQRAARPPGRPQRSHGRRVGTRSRRDPLRPARAPPQLPQLRSSTGGVRAPPRPPPGRDAGGGHP